MTVLITLSLLLGHTRVAVGETLPGTIAEPIVEPTPETIAPASGINSQSRTEVMQAEPYRFTAGDRIAVTIANIPEYSAQYQIQVDGTVNFSGLGAVSIWGLTVEEAADLLTTRYVETEILRDPTITVSLLTVSPLRIAITGEVNRPGSYSLNAADGKLPTLTQAIQEAGGITYQADLRQITMIRARRSGVDETFQINLWELLQSGDLRQDITLRDGDSIILTAAPMNPSEAGLIGAATVSPASIQVGVLGETRQTGVVQVPPNTPLNQVLLTAGGFNSRARRSSVELVRLNRDGTVTRRRIAIDLSDSINEATNPVLQNRDVVLVGRNFIATLSDNLSTILGPVNQLFSVFTLFGNLFPADSDSRSNIIIPAGGATSTAVPGNTSGNTSGNTPAATPSTPDAP
ncbi:SLBB domain-containing protein [Leptolyngbya ohadii]|uniref:SLBB domain-containing protein n=1 Tax=Leptolyngbya ohadii TaxID=1962290 RepID=UPI0015C5CA6B|nr:SLBB domain-containing protein [Leptolyngbya ohadii]